MNLYSQILCVQKLEGLRIELAVARSVTISALGCKGIEGIDRAIIEIETKIMELLKKGE